VHLPSTPQTGRKGTLLQEENSAVPRGKIYIQKERGGGEKRTHSRAVYSHGREGGGGRGDLNRRNSPSVNLLIWLLTAEKGR